MALLIIKIPGNPPLETEITGATVIGRANDVDLCLPHPDLSRRHCRIEPVDEFWRVVDLSSRMGTFVGEHRVNERFLKDSETIRLGQIEVEFHSQEEFAEEMQAIAPSMPEPMFEPEPAPMPQRPPMTPAEPVRERTAQKADTASAILEWESRRSPAAVARSSEPSPRRKQIMFGFASVALLAGVWLAYSATSSEDATPSPKIANASATWVQPKD